MICYLLNSYDAEGHIDTHVAVFLSLENAQRHVARFKSPECVHWEKGINDVWWCGSFYIEDIPIEPSIEEEAQGK